MVQDSRKTLRPGLRKLASQAPADAKSPNAGDIIRLNEPEAVEVKEGSKGAPEAVKTARLQVVAAIEDCFRLDDEWWREEPVSRLYYRVLLASGECLTIYKNLQNNAWYRQMY
jgi:hypothetical protein